MSEEGLDKVGVTLSISLLSAVVTAISGVSVTIGASVVMTSSGIHIKSSQITVM